MQQKLPCEEVPMKKMKQILEWITKVEYAIMIVAFVLMVVCYFTSVVNRNFIKASMPWAEELALYSMTFMALLGTEVGLRDGTQVAVTAVVEKLHGMTRKIVDLLKQVVMELFSFSMLNAGIQLVAKQMQHGQTTPVLKIPMAFMYSSLVLAFALILLVQTVTLIKMILDLKKKEADV